MKEDAEKRVKSNLTLEAIAKAENLQVTDEEVEEELSKMAEAYNLDFTRFSASSFICSFSAFSSCPENWK